MIGCRNACRCRRCGGVQRGPLFPRRRRCSRSRARRDRPCKSGEGGKEQGAEKRGRRGRERRGGRKRSREQWGKSLASTQKRLTTQKLMGWSTQVEYTEINKLAPLRIVQNSETPTSVARSRRRRSSITQCFASSSKNFNPSWAAKKSPPCLACFAQFPRPYGQK